MNQENYVVDHIYHMVHFANLRSIFKQRALISKEMLEQKGIVPRSIAFDSVQQLRNRIFVWDFFDRRYYKLHRYVPFYFARRPPMLYVQRDRGIQDDIVIFMISRAVIKESGVVFTDGNATNQQLSNTDSQQVGIVPVMVAGERCRRLYHPDSEPHGTNANCSSFYGNPDLLDCVRWDVITGSSYIDDKGEYTRIRSAEVLIPDQLLLKKIQGIAVSTEQMMREVNELIYREGLAGHIPAARIDPSLFL